MGSPSQIKTVQRVIMPKCNPCCSLACWIINFLLVCMAVGGGVVTLFSTNDDLDQVKNLYWYRQPESWIKTEDTGHIYYNVKYACFESLSNGPTSCLEYSDQLAGKKLLKEYENSGADTSQSTTQEAVWILLVVGFSFAAVAFLVMPCFFFEKLEKVYYFLAIIATFVGFVCYMSAFAVYTALLPGPVRLGGNEEGSNSWKCPVKPDDYPDSLEDIFSNCNYGPGFGCAAGVWCVLLLACIGICVGGKSFKKEGK